MWLLKLKNSFSFLWRTVIVFEKWNFQTKGLFFVLKLPNLFLKLPQVLISMYSCFHTWRELMHKLWRRTNCAKEYWHWLMEAILALPRAGESFFTPKHLQCFAGVSAQVGVLHLSHYSALCAKIVSDLQRMWSTCLVVTTSTLQCSVSLWPKWINSKINNGFTWQHSALGLVNRLKEPASSPPPSADDSEGTKEEEEPENMPVLEMLQNLGLVWTPGKTNWTVFICQAINTEFEVLDPVQNGIQVAPVGKRKGTCRSLQISIFGLVIFLFLSTFLGFHKNFDLQNPWKIPLLDVSSISPKWETCHQQHEGWAFGRRQSINSYVL
jgi:hypothetical protein